MAASIADWITEALEQLPDNFLITDPCAPGHPIVFASNGFLSMSGYAKHEILGHNARMFQGPKTDRRTVMAIREAIRDERSIQICILNYRRDGTPHWILFHMFPVFDEEGGCVVHFVAVQVPIPRRSACRSVLQPLLRSCRDEIRACGDQERCCMPPSGESFVDVDSRVFEEETREAGEWEKEKAISAASNIMMVLVNCSKLAGRRVCRKRCIPAAAKVAPLSAGLLLSLGRIKQSFVLVDPYLPDMPIVYASNSFLTLTGYSRDEVLGRNCRFLSGHGTDGIALLEIKERIQAEQACTVRILNYRKDGSSFWNLLHISPVRNASGKIAFIVEVQFDENSKCEMNGLSPQMWQLAAVGAIKVAIRSPLAGVGPSRSLQ